MMTSSTIIWSSEHSQHGMDAPVFLFLFLWGLVARSWLSMQNKSYYFQQTYRARWVLKILSLNWFQFYRTIVPSVSDALSQFATWTYVLVAPSNAVNWSFSLPPVDSRCLASHGNRQRVISASHIKDRWVTVAYSTCASWSNRYTRVWAAKEIVAIKSYNPAIISCNASPLSAFSVDIRW